VHNVTVSQKRPLHRRRPRFSRGGGSGVERFAFLCDLVTIAGNVQEELED